MVTDFDFRAEAVELYNTDSLRWMQEKSAENPNGLFEMIFADPPYFLSNGGITCHAGNMVSVHKGDWDQSQGPEANHQFNVEWIGLCQKLLKPDGTLWVSGTHHVIHSVGYAMQCLNMKILNSITWEKPNPPPNLSCRYFTHSTETVLWAAKTESSKHLFNYAEMRAANSGKQMKTVWQFTAPTKSEKAFGKHPTQKPVELLDRIILASTKPTDTVFDPFAGSATTGVSAIANGRCFVGCESDPEHFALAVKRLSSITPALGVA